MTPSSEDPTQGRELGEQPYEDPTQGRELGEPPYDDLWTVVGPLFRLLHLHLDEMIDAWRKLADTVAERAVAIGFVPDGQSATIASDSQVRAVERGELEDHVVVRQLTQRLAEVAERTRERMDRLGELDAASQNVAIEVVRALEEQLWMLRTQFPNPGRSDLSD